MKYSCQSIDLPGKYEDYMRPLSSSTLCNGRALKIPISISSINEDGATVDPPSAIIIKTRPNGMSHNSIVFENLFYLIPFHSLLSSYSLPRNCWSCPHHYPLHLDISPSYHILLYSPVVRGLLPIFPSSLPLLRLLQ